MNASTRTNDNYLTEMANLLDHFRKILEIENAAIERRDTATLRSLVQHKGEISKLIETLWEEFRPRMMLANEADRETFLNLNKGLTDLQPLIEHNMKLLNAAKVATAGRIEAGVKAWQRGQAEHSVEYDRDGRVSCAAELFSAKPERLI